MMVASMFGGAPGKAGSVRVELRLLAAMRCRLSGPDREKGAVDVELDAGSTVAELLGVFGIDPGAALVVLVNGRYADPDRELGDGDVVSVFPPVAGG